MVPWRRQLGQYGWKQYPNVAVIFVDGQLWWQHVAKTGGHRLPVVVVVYGKRFGQYAAGCGADKVASSCARALVVLTARGHSLWRYGGVVVRARGR